MKISGNDTSSMDPYREVHLTVRFYSQITCRTQRINSTFYVEYVFHFETGSVAEMGAKWRELIELILVGSFYT